MINLVIEDIQLIERELNFYNPNVAIRIMLQEEKPLSISFGEYSTTAFRIIPQTEFIFEIEYTNDPPIIQEIKLDIFEIIETRQPTNIQILAALIYEELNNHSVINLYKSD